MLFGKYKKGLRARDNYYIIFIGYPKNHNHNVIELITNYENNIQLTQDL